MMAEIRSTVFLALLLFLSPSPVIAEAVNPEADVRSAVAAFGEAFVAADVSVLNGLLEENYIHINGRSGNVLNKDDWLKWVGSRRAELESGALVVSEYRIEDLEVRIHGEAAVVAGVAVAVGARQGVPYDSRVRFTNVWVNSGGAWRRAAFHDSPLAENYSQ